ncbi:MAG: acylneuraminate cytidylyltransferase family protein [Planctomycetes bacterium]|nr:acylneuraminate cytidylyltransferase family protein [Planctomycetota bacterium]
MTVTLQTPGTTPRIVALVPMRHSSERVPGKNFRPLAGRPLYHHIVTSLLGSDRIDTVLIDTDSPVIREDCAAAFPGVRLVERPGHLRGGNVPMNEVLLHDVDQIEADFFLQTHSTNPLLKTATIDSAVDTMLAGAARHDSLFGVTRWHTRLYDAEGRPLNHDPSELLRTQDLPPVFEENSNIYIFTAASLRRHRSRIGTSPIRFEIDRLEAVDIDDEAAFRLAEMLLNAGAAPAEL